MECVKTNILIDNKETTIDVEKATMYAVSAMDIGEIEYEVLKSIVVLKRSELFKKVKNTPYYEKNYIVSIKKKKTKKIVKKAVEDTRGEVVLCNEKLVSLYYTMCCSGATANSEDVIDEKLTYIRKVYCTKCSNKESFKSIDVSDLKSITKKDVLFREEGMGIISNIERDEEGRIKSLTILGEKYSGKDIMKKLRLKSNKIYFKEEAIGIKTLGEGNGLGMCIEGAESLYKEGKTYEDIIKYYYTGVSFEKVGVDIANTLRGKVFLLDPGHGGEDSGNTLGEIKESEYVMDISLKLKELLEGKGAKVYLTREDDSNITLSERADVANKIKPDFFISIHLNSFVMPGVNGCEAYCYSEDNEAIELSDTILSEIEKSTRIKKRKVNIGDYFILRESKVNSMIIECFYLTGNIDNSLINKKTIDNLAKAFYSGVCKYYDIIEK